MDNLKNSMMNTILAIGLVIIIIGAFFIIYSDNEIEISLEDQNKIEEVVKEYYFLIEDRNYELAMFNCNFENSDMDINSKLRALYEVNESIVEELTVINSDGEAYFYKDKESIAYNVSINIKYRNTIGGDTIEIVLLSQVDGNWKIDTILGIDRYGYYRAPQYEYIRLVDFLDPRKDN